MAGRVIPDTAACVATTAVLIPARSIASGVNDTSTVSSPGAAAFAGIPGIAGIERPAAAGLSLDRSVALLRPLKAGLIALQYRHRALGTPPPS